MGRREHLEGTLHSRQELGTEEAGLGAEGGSACDQGSENK